MSDTTPTKRRRSEIAEQPDWAVTERNRTIQFTDLEVDTALRLLVANGGSPTRASEQLRGEGINVKRTTLQNWRDYSFPRRYIKLRTELSQEVAEQIAGSAMERAIQADEAEQAYIAKALEKLDEVDANHLAKSAQALAYTKGQNIEKAELLRGRPTQRVAVDLNESIEVLERLKVIEPTDEVIEAEVVEETDA